MRSRLQSVLHESAARLRGEQTLRQLRRLGLKAGDVYIAGRTVIDPRFAWAITIGDGTIIAHDVRIIAHDAAGRRVVGYTEVRPVTIGSECYIGAGAHILPGVTIGDRAIVGAGSIVRGDVAAGEVVAGVPARRLGTVEEFAAKQQGALATAPRYEVRGYELTADMREEALAALAEHGRIFVR